MTRDEIEIKAPGGPEMLVPVIRPVPEPKVGEMLRRIAGTGVTVPTAGLISASI